MARKEHSYEGSKRNRYGSDIGNQYDENRYLDSDYNLGNGVNLRREMNHGFQPKDDSWRRMDDELRSQEHSGDRRADYSGYYADADYDDPTDMDRVRGIRGTRRGGFFGKGPKGWKRSDQRIKEDVCEALYNSYAVDASEIEVEVTEGHVYLRGTVEYRENKREAERCIEDLSGVVDIHNEIKVGKLNVERTNKLS